MSAALSTTDERAFVTFNGVNARLEARLAKALTSPGLGAPKPGRRRARHVHLAFYPHDCGRWTRIVLGLRARGITTSWDFGWNEPLTEDRGLTGLVDALDFVFVNEHRSAPLHRGGDTRRRAGALATAARHRHREAGPDGSLWLAPNRDIHAPAPKVKVVDTTGAGDAFNGGFLVAWMNGASPAKCLAAGNKVGAASTRRAGGL